MEHKPALTTTHLHAHLKKIGMSEGHIEEVLEYAWAMGWGQKKLAWACNWTIEQALNWLYDGMEVYHD